MYRRAEINGLATEGQSLEDSAAAAGSESNFVKNHSYWEKNSYWEKTPTENFYKSYSPQLSVCS